MGHIHTAILSTIIAALIAYFLGRYADKSKNKKSCQAQPQPRVLHLWKK